MRTWTLLGRGLGGYRVPMATARALDDAVIAVIGATGGLGRALCSALSSRGATVMEFSRTTEVPIDLRDADAGTTVVDAVLQRHGRLDGVINAAGIVAFGELAQTDDVVIEELFLVDVLGPLWLTKRVIPALAESSGFICHISAVVAETPMPQMVPYSAAKAALSAALGALRRELRRQGIRVIDVRPPHTETGLADRPLAGTAPKLPQGLSAQEVAERVVSAILDGTDDVDSGSFR